MALTESTCVSNASRPSAKTTTNLLDFVNNASSSIQDHLAPKKKRNVNIRKYVQKRVKRLQDKPKQSGPTRSKSALAMKSTKPNAAQLLHNVGSRSWPHLATPNVQTQGYATTNYPTLCSPPSYHLYATSEASLYSAPATNNKAIDAELDSILSEFCLDSQPSTRHNSDSFQNGTLESQVVLGEHPYSPPTSDYSDDPFDGDSAYSSPVGSVGYTSQACSPPMPAEWPVHSPPTVPVTTQCPVTSTVWMPEQQPAVTGSGWLPQYTSYSQGPPMTSVSELLLDSNQYY